MPDPRRACDLHHSSQQCWILNPLCEARNRTHILMDASQICYHCAMTDTPRKVFYTFSIQDHQPRSPHAKHWTRLMWELCMPSMQANYYGVQMSTCAEFKVRTLDNLSSCLDCGLPEVS